MAKHFLDGYKTYDTAKGYGTKKQWQSAFRERMSTPEAERILHTQSETPYSLLGIQPGATATAIKKAFRQKISEWHPDRNQHRIEEAEAMSKKIIAAYTLLSA